MKGVRRVVEGMVTETVNEVVSMISLMDISDTELSVVYCHNIPDKWSPRPIRNPLHIIKKKKKKNSFYYEHKTQTIGI